MIKKILLFVLCAILMASCKFRHVMSVDEYEEVDKAVLEFDIDWSELNEEPTGATLIFYPCDENPVNPAINTIHTNKVNHITVTLPDQDYAVICFNQSETEFAALKFELDSFDNALVQIKSDEEMGNYSTKYDWTRGFNAQASIKPRSFASSSLSSVKSQATRGFNAQASIKPRSSIKSLSLSVSVFGINKSVLVKSKLKNLSSGLKLGSSKLLKETVDQEIPTDSWDLSLATEDNKPSLLNTSLGTFGIDPDWYKTKTRADVEEADPVILSLDFFMPDGSNYHVDIDVTEQLLRQLMGSIESRKDYLSIIIGDKNDPNGTNSAENDFITEHGSIVLHHTFEGMGVYVDKWGEPIIQEIVLTPSR